MFGGVELPALRFALPLQSERHWSDMLAVLIETDPLPLGATLGWRHVPAGLSVSREAPVNSANRPDIVLTADGACVAVIEVKVLAGLGPSQLERYHDAAPGAEVYVLVHPEYLPVPLPGASPWRGLTWEALLQAYEDSGHSWVAATARAWRRHLDSALPQVGPGTRWDDLRPGEDFVIAMRARMSWLYSQIRAPAGVEHDLTPSSAGVSWVASLHAPTPVPGYRIMTQVEEYLPVRDWPRHYTAEGFQPLGPSAKVCLYQAGVTTSAGFDWDYLLRLWPVMDQARTDWVSAIL
jgi:PD-(D/E)XK nuclease superfamily